MRDRRKTLGILSVFAVALAVACGSSNFAAVDDAGADDGGTDGTLGGDGGGPDKDGGHPGDDGEATKDGDQPDTTNVTVDASDCSIVPNESIGSFASSGTANLTGPCTASSPCGTISAAIAWAQAQNPQRTIVYVDKGTYTDHLALVAGMTIQGGWEKGSSGWTFICDNNARANAVTVVASDGQSETALADNLAGTTTLDTINLHSHAAAATAGESLYGLIVRGATTKVSLIGVGIAVRTAGTGTTGSVGGTGGAGPAVGACDAGNGQTPSAGGGGTGAGTGGFGATGYTPGGGGAIGVAGGKGGDAVYAAPQCSNACRDCEPSGPPAPPGSCDNVGAIMVCGNPGGPGCGGGGGVGGGPGGGGGSSIALYVWQGSVTTQAGLLSSSNAGGGGPGGAGGPGGPGSAGAVGQAALCPSGCGNPCVPVADRQYVDGGIAINGATGGAGGPGGGGAGGYSYSYYSGSSGAVTVGGTNLQHGNAGGGGQAAGGIAGASGQAGDHN